MKILVVSNKKSKRVSLIPSDVKKLTENKIEVVVLSDAGKCCGFRNEDYVNAGAKIVEKINEEIMKDINIVSFIDFPENKMILKCLTPNQLLWGFMYLVNNPKNLLNVLRGGITSLAVETINTNNVYEYFLPMEQIKGEYSMILAANALASIANGKGKFIGHIAEYKETRTKVVILNYSYAGYYAAKAALANGCDVVYLETDHTLAEETKNDKLLNKLCHAYGSKFEVKEASYDNIKQEALDTDILITTNQLPTTKTPMRITKEMIESMPKGGVFINLASETGFASSTEVKPTSVENQSVLISGINHIDMGNIHDIYPLSSSQIISNLNAKNFLEIAKEKDIHNIIATNEKYKNAIMTYRNCLTNKEIAISLHLKYTNIDTIKKV